jgi:hypothetical protein
MQSSNLKACAICILDISDRSIPTYVDLPTERFEVDPNGAWIHALQEHKIIRCNIVYLVIAITELYGIPCCGWHINEAIDLAIRHTINIRR